MPITSDHSRITSIRDLRYLAGERVSGSSLRFFRVAFGCVVALSAVRLLRRGWIASLYSDPIFRFSYSGMGWVPVLPTPLMKVQVALIAVAAIAVVFNLRYRIAITTLWFLFTWMEFTEATVYLNHYWFITVMSFLMIFLPLNSRGSVPRGAVWMVRFQVGLVYCFAGIAKLNTDWLVHGLPMALWLPGRSNFPVIGWVFEYQQVAIALSWAGAIFDCTIVAFLLWKRTRFVAWLAVVAFHVATYLLFPSIGVFPLLMVAASLVFFEPDWIERGSPNGLGPRLDVSAEWLGLTDSNFDYAALDLEAADPVPDQPTSNGVVFPVDQPSVPPADGWPSGPPIAGADNHKPVAKPVVEPRPDHEQEPESARPEPE
ncbi:MAG: HTTM domain-containing protein, partial [Microthrixaceae bacterium]|nr:HTTM domain-containing protein [Microthrixaceae bacterium]